MSAVEPSAADQTVMPAEPGGELQRHVRHTFVTQLLSSAFQWGAGILVARSLGPAGKGELALALWLTQLLHLLCYFGLGDAAISLMNRSRVAAVVVGNLHAVMLGMILVGGLGYFALAPWVLGAVDHQVSWALYRQAFWLVPLTLTWACLATDLLGLGHVKEVNWGRVLNQTIFLALIGVCWIRRLSDVAMVIWAMLAAALVEVLFLMVMLHRRMPLRLGWHAPTLRQLIHRGSQFAVGNWLDFFSRRVDILLASAAGGISGVGAYAVAVGLRDMTLILPQMFVRPLLSASARFNRQEVVLLVEGALRQVLWVLLAVSAVLWWLMPWVVRTIYSDAFIEALSPARWLLLSTLALGVSDLIITACIGLGQARRVMLTKAVILGGVVLTGPPLTRLWGLSGLAMAVGFSQVIGLLTLMRGLRAATLEADQR